MKTIKHSLHFVTELDETNPTSKKLLDLPADEQIMLLEGMLKELVAPKLSKTIKELNENNSFATLSLA
jgi:hypothetical protein